VKDLVEFIDRQFAYLDCLASEAYIYQVGRWLRTLDGEPRIAGFLRDMRQEAVASVKNFFGHDDDLVARLKALRFRLAEVAADGDDSKMVRPPNLLPGSPFLASFAHFDEITGLKATDTDRAMPTTGTENKSRSTKLMRILRSKLSRLQHTRSDAEGREEHSQENLRPDLDEFGFALTNLEREHEHEFRNFLMEKLTSGGVSLLHLINFISGLNPVPEPLSEKHDDLLKELNRHMGEWGSGIDKLRGQVFGEATSPLLKKDDHAGNWESDLRPHVRRIHEEVRRRIGTRRSLVGVLHRFKERCEWHDRERLRDIAERARQAGRKPEDALTAEFARWLFDQGFSPLTEPSVGGLKPDLLDPSLLYVEAKRYSEADSGRTAIIKGAKQVYSTVQMLRGTKYEIDEAVFVVFRESGPLYLLPEAVPCGGWVMLPVLIDIAPMSEVGRREKHQPISITVEELAPQREEDARPE
jgi:hypothetical protein